ncbi:MAG: helix-turn-helix domain-containing protein [Xanthomonadaceae bacterium]|nr:helix-turn-helix domain-containing protein [Xanthomonadaceae bacterium]
MKKPSKPLEISIRASNQLGQAIERARKRLDLSQTLLAKSAGTRQATISNIEKGIGSTKIETLFAICAALGIEVVLRERASSSKKPSSTQSWFE